MFIVHQQQIDLETIKSYLEEIRLHQQNQENLLKQIRQGFPHEIGREVEEQLRYALQSSIETIIRLNYRSELDNVIRSEVLKQVEKQVNAQIVEHIPVGLQQQAEESDEQVRDIKLSLTNSYVIIIIIGAVLDIQKISKSRIANSYIQSRDLDEPLAPILNSEGRKSSLYPSNLRSLFAYDRKGQ